MLSSDKSILSNGVTPNTSIFLQYKNNNYDILKGNGFKYTFVYNFDLSDFLNPTADSIKRAQVISHEQMSINFNTNLTYFNGYQYYIRESYIAFKGIFRQLMRREIYNTATVGYLYDVSASATTYSQQYLTNGITLKDYMQSVINALPGIVSQCPVNMQNVQDYFPENYVTNYIYTDLQGNTTTKTSSLKV